MLASEAFETSELTIRFCFRLRLIREIDLETEYALF